MTGRILVTGASGKTGNAVARHLVAAGAVVRVASRRATPLAGAAAVAFDWRAPETWPAALADVERIYLLTPPGDNAPLTTVAPFIDRALALGARRLVLLSSSQIAEGGPAMGAVHAYLRQVAPEWAVLRPSWFMDNFVNEPHLSSIRDAGAIYSATGDGRVPFVAVEDIAAVAARTLLQGDAPEHDLLITGPELLGYDDIAHLCAAARGAPVRHVRLSVAALTERHIAGGLAPDYAATLAGLDGLIAAGAEDRLSDVVRRCAGRDGVRFQDFAATNAARWRTAT
jgi:ergot alkaloid biosynthesis protein